ncbi:MAG TPA: hypothetical protein VJ951_16330 [Bacteroidales bacterium]|nr:hypothetical protein [Bacteroidales bacterium]
MENLDQKAELQEKMELTPLVLDHLNQTRKWTRFLAIVGFIFSGLIVLIAIISLTFNKSGLVPFGAGAAGVLPMLIVAGLYFFPVLYLHRYSTLSKQAVDNNDTALMVEALKFQKKFFKFIGVLAIVLLSIWALALLFMIAGDLIAPTF